MTDPLSGVAPDIPTTDGWVHPSCLENTPPTSAYETGVGAAAVAEARAVGWSEDLGVFLASGWHGPNQFSQHPMVLQSVDGMTWTTAAPGTPYIGGSSSGGGRYLWIPELHAWLATESGAFRPFHIGPNGDGFWTYLSITVLGGGGGSGGGFASAWSGSMFVVGGDISGGAGASHSIDGYHWTESDPGLPFGPTIGNSSLKDAVWDPAHGVFVAAGLFAAFPGDRGIATTPDGDTWTEYSCPLINPTSLCWSPALSRIVVGNSADTSPAFAYSDDGGATWTAAASPWDGSESPSPGVGSVDVTQIVWSTELDLFVAVGWPQFGGVPGDGSGLWALNPSTAVVATSPDGESWTAVATPLDGGRAWAIAWSLGLGRLVVVGQAADKVHTIMTSTDAVNWSLVPNPIDGSLGTQGNFFGSDTFSACSDDGTFVPPTVAGSVPTPPATSSFKP